MFKRICSLILCGALVVGMTGCGPTTGDDNKTSYELNTSEHKHHLVCKQCKEVFPINDCPLCVYEQHIRDDMDFDVTEHRLEIYGYCKACKKMTKE